MPNISTTFIRVSQTDFNLACSPTQRLQARVFLYLGSDRFQAVYYMLIITNNNNNNNN